MSDYRDNVAKYVVSATLTDPQWQNSTVLSGDPVEQARALKTATGGDIVVTGRGPPTVPRRRADIRFRPGRRTDAFPQRCGAGAVVAHTRGSVISPRRWLHAAGSAAARRFP